MLCSHNFGNYSESNPRWAGWQSLNEIFLPWFDHNEIVFTTDYCLVCDFQKLEILIFALLLNIWAAPQQLP